MRLEKRRVEDWTKGLWESPLIILKINSGYRRMHEGMAEKRDAGQPFRSLRC